MTLVLVEQPQCPEDSPAVGRGEVSAREGREERVGEVERLVLMGHGRSFTEVAQARQFLLGEPVHPPFPGIPVRSSQEFAVLRRVGPCVCVT